jgi:hypothetical protein
MTTKITTFTTVLETATSFLTKRENAHPECSILEWSSSHDNDGGVLTPKSEWEPVSSSRNDSSSGLCVDDDDNLIRNQWVLSTSAMVEYESLESMGYVTLLAVQGNKWTVISIVYASRTPTQKGDGTSTSRPSSGSPPCLPIDFNGVMNCCWERYGKANRECNGNAMSQVFHPQCRLTYSNPKDGTVTVVSSVDFCTMVSNRYSLPLHAPHAKYKDTAWVSSRDTLLGISMVIPHLALVRLKVAHPPFLWTDLLVCAKLHRDENDAVSGTKNDTAWWIVAKSSSSESFVKVDDADDCSTE